MIFHGLRLESCFSELEFFNYNNMNQNILKELAKVSNSNKKLIIHLIDDDILELLG